MDNLFLPKVLVLGRVPWTDNESTMSSIFSSYPSSRLAYICIESGKPNFKSCSRHFHISEVAMAKKFFNWRIPVGYEQKKGVLDKNEKRNSSHENKIGHFVRNHRSILFLYLREFLWSLNNWKSKELKSYIDDFSPDILFMMGDPLPLMNRLYLYVKSYTKKRSCVYMMDDIYSYKNCHNPLQYLYRLLLRKKVRKVVNCCEEHFSISPMMQREYDAIFGIQSQVVTKSISTDFTPLPYTLHNPIRLVYTGKLIYGRDTTLSIIAKEIEKINTGKKRIELHIYTQTSTTSRLKRMLDIPGSSYIHQAVPYNQMQSILEKSDILLFVESLSRRYKYTARLSFSTKITDYLGSGKCIFAVGAKDIAPIDYLTREDVAYIANSTIDLPVILNRIIKNTAEIESYAYRAYELGKKKHSKEHISDIITKTLLRLYIR